MSRPTIRTSRALTAARIVGLMSLTTVFILPVGCYRHVVGTKNAPGYTGPVYEANVEEGNENLFKTRTVTPKGSYYVE